MGSLVLTDAAGNLVYQQSTESIAESIIEDVQFGKSQEVVQEGYFVKKIAVENTDWQLAYLVSKQEVTGILWPIIQQTILVLIICLMFSIILISYLSKQITSRLYQLSADSDSVANGALNSIEFTEDQDEIGIVTNSIAKMQQSQHELTEKLVTSEIERSDVEKKSLQSMIHPHFLYNTLSSMKWKAIYHDETEIAQGLSWLATFYRTSLNSGHFFTTVENELENVHAYIDLQQVMHEQKFTVNESVEEETLACRMPNFLLQPLIENGIQHGFAMNDMKGLASILNIRIYLSEDQLIIEIENNGATFDREKLARALEHKGNGYGLYNLRRRLELAYGERGHIYFEEIAADFTRIRIVIPKESNES
ncbi:sensor histidine kinase [Enterococcus sp. LJL90]